MVQKHHPEFYAANFTADGALNSGYDYKSLSEELRADLDIYAGYILVPYAKLVVEELIVNGKIVDPPA